MKTVAVITGASSGIGKRFVETLSAHGTRYDELWVIARRADRLEKLRADCPIKVIAADLTDRGDLEKYRGLLREEKPNVALLINCSGFGKFAAVADTPPEENMNMVDLNCRALMAMCQFTIPYMHRGARIINIASVAAFQPIPYISVYGATKSFVLSFSRSLNRELKSRGIGVTAVCPFWTRTEFFDRAVDIKRDPVVKKYPVLYEPDQIV